MSVKCGMGRLFPRQNDQGEGANAGDMAAFESISAMPAAFETDEKTGPERDG